MRKVRVLHVFNIMNRGGAETFIMNIYRNINKDKVIFDFLCTSPKKGAYDEEIQELGGNIFHLKYDKRLPFRNMLNLLVFLKKEGPFDVIHIPLMFYSGIVCIIAKLAGIKKIIVHSHNAGETSNNNLLRKIYRRIMRFLINYLSDYKLSCGTAAAIFLFGSMKNVIIINNGVDVQYFQLCKNRKKLLKEFGIKDDFIIGNIARFVPEKNHQFFINFALFLKNNNIKAKIILVGDGVLKKDIQNKIRKNALEKYIILTGVREDIRDLLHIFNVLIMPSIHEGFPVTIIESLSAGIPCLLSDTIDSNVAIIKDMVSFLSLSEKYDIWYQESLNLQNKILPNNQIKKIMNNSGFDINVSVKLLEDIYLRR